MAAPLRAKQISSESCPHGNIHVLLHDEDGEVIAVANMPAATAFEFVEQLTPQVLEALKLQGSAH